VTVPVIALDGPAGVGKSTVAKGVARRLGYYFLSSGLIYRVMAWYLSERGWDGGSTPDGAQLDSMHLTIAADQIPRLDGEPIRADLHSDRISALASVVSQHAPVRDRCNAIQREIVSDIGRTGVFAGVVLEGRDIGTVVFPDAAHKFFVTASDEVRAERRYLELREMEPGTRREEVLASIRERDRRDRTRDVAPLRAAEDAVTIDTSRLDAEQVIEAILSKLKRGGDAA